MKFIRNILILLGLLVALLFLRSCGTLMPMPCPVSDEDPEKSEKEQPVRTVVAIKEVQDKPAEEPGNEGQFIAVSADYRQSLGFPGYVSQMKRLGGRFVLFNTTRQQIVAEVDPVAGVFTPMHKTLFDGMSPRTREVQKEIAVSRALRKGEELYGAGRYTILLLLPQSIDDRMQSELSGKLTQAGLSPSKVVKVSGVYREQGGLILDVHAVQFDDGTVSDCSFIVKL